MLKILLDKFVAVWYNRKFGPGRSPPGRQKIEMKKRGVYPSFKIFVSIALKKTTKSQPHPQVYSFSNSTP
ncbi:MAG: hypothetical protein J6R67_03665 [Treponema sp.]|nr:hypothetical protein [Treponema sp.]